ncbi:MAG TPA: DUF1002 domain-containing protein, partial [Desulfobacteria bacterium]|nr:DUF1002 domain-containing protein [Desulfobacteria bacterium]
MKRAGLLIRIFTAIFLTIFFAGSAAAEYSRVVTFGADLTGAQRTMLASEFGVDLTRGEVPVVEITNAEERKYLEGLVSDRLIGNKAISSALVEMLPQGQGINVETRNITWVTTNMYENALVTAGVTDARIVVAAPFPVSGTAALTGIFKAVEYATGRSLGNKSKKIANEELVQTGQLGQEIGKEKASRLILLVKERIVRERPKTRVEIRQIIVNVAGELNINLTKDQIEEITTLMQKVNGLQLNIGEISRQINGL